MREDHRHLREAQAAAGGDGEEESGGEESDEEELDPAQVDSPTTLRALAAVGVTNVADASPGTLQRAWSAVRGIGRTLFGGDDDDAEGGGDGVQGTGDSVLEYLDTDTDAERLAKTIAARAARHNPRELDRPLESSEKQAIHDTMLVGMATGVYPKNSDSKREYAAAAERLVCARTRTWTLAVCAMPHAPPFAITCAPDLAYADALQMHTDCSGADAHPSPCCFAAPSNGVRRCGMPAPTAVAPPLQLVVPSRAPSASGTSKTAAKKKMHENPWPCTCLANPKKGGRKWHAAACARAAFERAGGKAGAAAMPVVGTTVVCLQSAGPRAGKKLICRRVHKDGWEDEVA